MEDRGDQPSDADTLIEVLSGIRCIFLDFDGPLSHLFVKWPSQGMAGTFRAVLDRANLHSARLSAMTDPYAMFRALPECFPERSFETDRQLRSVAREFEEQLTTAEIKRVDLADPTSGAVDCVQAMYDTGRTLAIATNNSPEPVQAFLKTHGIDRLFDGRVFGRGWDPRLLKPHPDTVRRALAVVAQDGISAEQCLLVGDTPADLAAARAAGVGFIGYCVSAAKARALQDDGVRYWVDSMNSLRRAVAGAA